MQSVPVETAPVQTAHGEVFLWLTTQAYDMRRRNHPWSEYLARQIEDLAGNVAFLKACTPEDLTDRLEVLERGHGRP